MSKWNLIAVSIVAAVPGAFLAYLMVSAFLSGADSMSGIMMALVGITLATSATVALTPVGIAVFGGKQPAVAEEPETASAGAESAEELDEYDAESGELEEAEFASSGEIEDVDFATDEVAIAESGDEFDEFDIDFEDDDKK